MSLPQEDWATFLKRRRQSLGLTQEDLAYRVGCSLEIIRKIEIGRRRPSPQVVELLATHLNLTPEERDRLFSETRPDYNQAPNNPDQQELK